MILEVMSSPNEASPIRCHYQECLDVSSDRRKRDHIGQNQVSIYSLVIHVDFKFGDTVFYISVPFI